MTTTSVKIKTATMQNWVDRRRRKHKNFTSDELWAKIRANWPNLTDEEQESIYQGVRM